MVRAVIEKEKVCIFNRMNIHHLLKVTLPPQEKKIEHTKKQFHKSTNTTFQVPHRVTIIRAHPQGKKNYIRKHKLHLPHEKKKLLSGKKEHTIAIFIITEKKKGKKRRRNTHTYKKKESQNH